MYAEITMVVEIMEDINNPSNKALLMEDITDADALVMKSYFVVGVRSIDAKEWAGKEKHRMASSCTISQRTTVLSAPAFRAVMPNYSSSRRRGFLISAAWDNAPSSPISEPNLTT